jgi:quaternary ammonium compound-resistance protein SugE
MTLIAQMIVAALLFAVGGLFMKLSDGATRTGYTLLFCALFLAGAVLQASAMRRADLGVVYIAVLGLEAAIAFGISVLIFGESASPGRVVAVLVIIAGVVMLRRT